MQTVQFDDVTTFILMLIGLMTFIVLTFNVSQAIRTWRNQGKQPLQKLEEEIHELQPQIVPNLEDRLASIDRRLSRAEEKLDGDWEFRASTIEFNKLMLRTMKELIKHEVSGNDVSELRALEKEIDNFLVQGRHSA